MLVEQIEALLKMITVSENRIFDDFSANIVGRIDDCLASLKKVNKPSSIANISKAVEKLSTSFHEERIGAHYSLWKSPLVALKLPQPDPLWCQSVNRCLFDIMKLDLVQPWLLWGVQ